VGALNVADRSYGIGRGLASIRARDADSRFIWWWLHSQKSALDAVSAGTTYRAVTAEDIGRLPFPRIDAEEQRRIADFLDSVTSRIDRLCALQTLVLQKIDQRDRAVRDTLLDGLIAKVGLLPFRRFILKVEQGSSPACENYPCGPGEWGVVKLSAVKQGNFIAGENKKLPDDLEPMPQYEIRNGDLLVTRANTPELVGDVAVVENVQPRLLLPDLIYRVVPSPKIDAKFAAEVLQSSRVRSLVQAGARGSSQSMVKLRGEDIRGWPIPNASVEQQVMFASAMKEQLRASEKLRKLVARQLALLTERRQALIAAAVARKIDVTTARGLFEVDGVAV
jgi:type I restriction enzyme S subunit